MHATKLMANVQVNGPIDSANFQGKGSAIYADYL